VLLIHVKVNQDDSQMRILKLEEHEDVDEDENEEEMNVSIIHHKQTLFKNIKINLQNKSNILTVPGGILKFAVKTGASASRLVSSFSPGGTNNELHNLCDAKLLNNNFYQ